MPSSRLTPMRSVCFSCSPHFHQLNSFPSGNERGTAQPWLTVPGSHDARSWVQPCLLGMVRLFLDGTRTGVPQKPCSSLVGRFLGHDFGGAGTNGVNCILSKCRSPCRSQPRLTPSPD